MIRILIFILWIIFFAAALTLLFSLRAAVPVEAFGWRMDIPSGLAILAAVSLSALVAMGTSAIKDMLAAPKLARARKELERREKGVAAIAKGFDAIAAGDAAAAMREARTAEKTLGAAAAARLLTARAAELGDDAGVAGEALAALLNAPETEFVALRGLYAKAMREGDLDGARKHAERAFERKADARWAFDAVFDSALRRGDFSGAQSALARAMKAKAIEQGAAERGLAATLTAAAYSSYAAGDSDTALECADAALKHAPGLAPAAIMAARLHAAKGDLKKSDKILAAAFAEAPSRAVAEGFSEIFRAEGASAFERLASKNPDSREAALLRAQAALLRGDGAGASGELAAPLKAAAHSRALLLMAHAQSATSGEGAARAWLLRAAAAPREDDPPADAFGRITGDGWRRLILNYMSEGRLSSPPLESPPPGLADEELGSLAPRDEIEFVETDAEQEVESAPVDDRDADEALNREAAAAREVS